MLDFLNVLFRSLSPLWEMSVTAAYAAAVVIVLRLLLKKRAPKQVLCLLWLVVFARLLIPASLESPLSIVPNALSGQEHIAGLASAGPGTEDPAAPIIPQNPAQDQPHNQTGGGTATPVTGSQNPSLSIPEGAGPAASAPEAPASFPWQAVVAGVWLTGSAAMGGYALASWLRLRRRLFDAIRAGDGAWEHPAVDSPFILGVLRPRIYLPAGLTGQSRQFILCHERAHLRRLDHIVKPVCWIALALHWFNPLAWAAFLLMSRDIESACDEAVVRQLGSEIKADYSDTLLALATGRRIPAPCPLTFDEGDARNRIRNVLNYRRPALWAIVISAVAAALAAVCLLTDPVAAKADPTIGSSITDGNTPITVISDDDNSHVMTGANGAVLLVDSISTQEYAELMEVLYPNGVIDGQGLNIPGIDNIPEARAQFIAEHMKAYAFNGTEKAEVDLIPFEITVTDKANGAYEALLYKATIGNDAFVFPSEWGNQSFGFASLSEKNIYLAFTDMGIWRIDPDSMSAEKLTADTYWGKNQAAASAEFEDSYPGWYLTWIDSVWISPDGGSVVYRTNRDSAALSETSLWKIDLSTGKEAQFVSPAVHNDVVGFITDSDIVVGSLRETRVVSLADGMTVPVDVPELPNLRVSSAKNGIIVFCSYEDGSSDTTAYINRVDLSTGKVSPIAEVVGYLNGEPIFSPSGSKVAIGYGTDPMKGADDVMIVDLATKTQSLLTQSTVSMQSAQITNQNIAHFLWIDDSTILAEN